MKKRNLIIFIQILFTIQLVAAQSTSPEIGRIQKKLEQVNKFWKYKDLEAVEINHPIDLSNEVLAIQLHLSMVEKKLRKKSTSKLTDSQRKNRIKCLDILNDYWKRGVFPINLYHSERTPYFVDANNTACAVGQLIRETSFNNLVDKIQKENNYSYIDDLVIKYPEINLWSEKFGFEVEELAWIQPCYPCNPPPGITNVSCFGGYDGSFSPTFDSISGTPPYLFEGIYRWYNSEWTYLPCGGCDLRAGEYKSRITDAAGIQYEEFATIIQPDSLYSVMTSTIDTDNCNGSATAEINGGTFPYSVLWSPSGQTTNTAIELCEGMYSITIIDGNGCIITDSIEVELSTGINSILALNYSISPNPTSGRLSIDLNDFAPENLVISILNMEGKNIFTKRANNDNIEFDLSSLMNGVYFLSVSDGINSVTKKILKI